MVLLETDFLAHLSQRLIGELIGYSWSGVHPFAALSFTMLKDLLFRNRFANQSEIFGRPDSSVGSAFGF